jgi:quercetin dioxygenase-like cupin family protein
VPFLDTATRPSFSLDRLSKVSLLGTADLFCDLYCLEPGQAQKVHAHGEATKLYYVITGRGELTVGDETRLLGRGEIAWAAPGEPHGASNPGPDRLVLLVVMAPNPNPGAGS